MTRTFTTICIVALTAVGAVAQGSIDAAARKAIDAGNEAWVTGMKAGNAQVIANTYAEDAVDCSAEGNCIRGRAAIEAYFKHQLSQSGRAQSATVRSAGAAPQGDFVYEWGRADATLSGSKKVGGRYLTVWRRQPDGSWKIFRNMPIPADTSQ